ncbi:hypothetical protein G6F57_017143 [Rhizopus arrhizus]|nr:hypothetical protein G6F57_017143 [Rhizopus arrhizus]
MSDSAMPFQPAIELPSNILPSSNSDGSTMLTGKVTCCSTPRMSTKRRSTNSIWLSLISFSTFSTDIGTTSDGDECLLRAPRRGAERSAPNGCARHQTHPFGAAGIVYALALLPSAARARTVHVRPALRPSAGHPRRPHRLPAELQHRPSAHRPALAGSPLGLLQHRHPGRRDRGRGAGVPPAPAAAGHRLQPARESRVRVQAGRRLPGHRRGRAGGAQGRLVTAGDGHPGGLGTDHR